MKFLLDMSISPKSVEFLKKSGYEAVRMNDLEMARSKDQEIFQYAIENNMILITMT